MKNLLSLACAVLLFLCNPLAASAKEGDATFSLNNGRTKICWDGANCFAISEASTPIARSCSSPDRLQALQESELMGSAYMGVPINGIYDIRGGLVNERNDSIYVWIKVCDKDSGTSLFCYDSTSSAEDTSEDGNYRFNVCGVVHVGKAR